MTSTMSSHEWGNIRFLTLQTAGSSFLEKLTPIAFAFNLIALEFQGMSNVYQFRNSCCLQLCAHVLEPRASFRKFSFASANLLKCNTFILHLEPSFLSKLN